MAHQESSAPVTIRLEAMSCGYYRLVMKAFAHGIHGNRGTIWPLAWERLAAAYGGNVLLAHELGVSYQTVYRWAVKGAPVPRSSAKLIALLAHAKGLASPVT